MFSEIMLMQCLDVSFDTATHILGAAAAKVVPPLSTALRVHRQRLECQAHLQTQLASLDRALKGGIPVGSITELERHGRESDDIWGPSDAPLATYF